MWSVLSLSPQTRKRFIKLVRREVGPASPREAEEEEGDLLAFKIFSIINQTDQWMPRRRGEVQTKGLCGQRGDRARWFWTGEGWKCTESELDWKMPDLFIYRTVGDTVFEWGFAVFTHTPHNPQPTLSPCLSHLPLSHRKQWHRNQSCPETRVHNTPHSMALSNEVE